MDWLLSSLVIISNFLVGRKNKWGWIVGAVASLLWMVYAVFVLNPAQYGLLVSAGFNFSISVASAIKWFKE